MFTALVLLTLSQTPECRTSGLQTACGFHCRAELDQVMCAQTPQGTCERVEGKLVCWDPPEEVRLHSPTSRPDCRMKYGEIACGFSCGTSETQLACTSTPWGVCSMRNNKVSCWDPSAAVIHNFASKGLSGAKCLQTNSSFACGWDCKESYRDVQCAQTPQGKCSIFEGKIVCFDPPIAPVNHAS